MRVIREAVTPPVPRQKRMKSRASSTSVPVFLVIVDRDHGGRNRPDPGQATRRLRAIGTRRALAHAVLPVLHFAGRENVVAVSDFRPVSDVALFFELFNGRLYGFGS